MGTTCRTYKKRKRASVEGYSQLTDEFGELPSWFAPTLFLALVAAVLLIFAVA